MEEENLRPEGGYRRARPTQIVGGAHGGFSGNTFGLKPSHVATKQGRGSSGGGKYGFSEKGRWGNRGNVGGTHHGSDVHHLNKADYGRYKYGDTKKGALDKLYYSSLERKSYGK